MPSRQSLEFIERDFWRARGLWVGKAENWYFDLDGHPLLGGKNEGKCLHGFPVLPRALFSSICKSCRAKEVIIWTRQNVGCWLTAKGIPGQSKLLILLKFCLFLKIKIVLSVSFIFQTSIIRNYFQNYIDFVKSVPSTTSIIRCLRSQVKWPQNNQLNWKISFSISC